MAQRPVNDHAQTVRDALSKNVVIDIGARVGYLVTRFFIPPFVLGHVGLEAYGLWATAFIIVSYVGISTFGISSVYVKYVAEYTARGEPQRANALLSTGLVTTSALCLIIFALLLVWWPLVVDWLQVPDALRDDAYEVILLVVGIFLASLALSGFSNALSGGQRQAAVQGIWVVAYLVETVLIFLLISQGRGIRGLAEAFFLRMILEIGLSAVVAFRTLPWLKISPRFCTRESLRLLVSFGGTVQILGFLAIALNSIERAVAVPPLFAPPGPALVAAESCGLASRPFTNPWEFGSQLRPFLAAHRHLAFVATGVVHSLVWCLWNTWYRRRAVHLHIVHGGTDERDSYGRKKLLNHLGVRFIAVSEFVKERLVAHGVRADRIAVIENFLPDAAISSSPKRGPFESPGVQRVLIVSRLDPIKRVDLVFDALERLPHLDKLLVRIFGTGWDLTTLQARAEGHHPNVTIAGFSTNMAAELTAAHLLLHPCPAEPFGLAILEAMAAGVQVLVADAGGAASLVDEGVSGFHFHANDAEALAQRLSDLAQASAVQLTSVVAGGYRALATRFSATACLADYRRLLDGGRP